MDMLRVHLMLNGKGMYVHVYVHVYIHVYVDPTHKRSKYPDPTHRGQVPRPNTQEVKYPDPNGGCTCADSSLGNKLFRTADLMGGAVAKEGGEEEGDICSPRVSV